MPSQWRARGGNAPTLAPAPCGQGGGARDTLPGCAGPLPAVGRLNARGRVRSFGPCSAEVPPVGWAAEGSPRLPGVRAEVSAGRAVGGGRAVPSPPTVSCCVRGGKPRVRRSPSAASGSGRAPSPLGAHAAMSWGSAEEVSRRDRRRRGPWAGGRAPWAVPRPLASVSPQRLTAGARLPHAYRPTAVTLEAALPCAV